MIVITLDKASLESATQALLSIRANLPKEVATAINETAKSGVGKVAEKIFKRINIKLSDIKKRVKVFPKANTQSLVAGVNLSKSDRIPLKYFGARQVAEGVAYKIERTGGRKVVPSAFGPDGFLGGRGARGRAGIARLGFNAFRREGKPRLPIVKLHGPSPWGVFVKAGLTEPTAGELRLEATKKLNDRVRFLTLKAQGKI